MARGIETSFLSGANAPFIAEMYARYVEDPAAVDPSWRGFFGELTDDPAAVATEVKGASWRPRTSRIIGNGRDMETAGVVRKGATDAEVRAAAVDSFRALMLIRAYRERGHLAASLDPLGLEKPKYHPELDPTTYGFGDGDYDRPIFVAGHLSFETASLRQILAAAQATYCGNVGVEYMHITDPDRRAWIQERIEGERNRTDFTPKGKRMILDRMIAAETFERFCGVKWVGTKRFGLDGAEALIPGLEQIVKRGGQLGLKEVVIGMPHRGRLNVLTNFMKKPFKALFSEFQGNPANPEEVQGSGDVKYHMGTSSDREFDGNVVHLSLTANPSHLEAVNPVVEGKARAKQQQLGDKDRKMVLPLLLHGDAAFAGQGLVPETLMLSELKGYKTGGTLHFIVNNQIGFTTAPSYSRSSPYPSDVARMVDAPIFHVNGDDPESVVHVSRIATEYRQQFGSDVVIDMFCYRRFGHNESDEPMFTQPLMYKKIATHSTAREIYAQRLVEEGTITKDEAEGMVAAFRDFLETEFQAATSYRPNKADWLEGKWLGLGLAADDDRRGDTAVDIKVLKEVGAALGRVPEGFTVNSKLVRQLEAKKKMVETGEGIDWALGEALAFGTLVLEGVPVRLSGQDSGRGTFSHRHAVLVDQKTEQRHVPLNHIREGQATFEVHDSPLSEQAVLGFEYGYSLADPNSLVLWEAQFGDFVNGAQIIIDQFIAAGEIKWLRMSGLTLLLPHGFEGAGPEHSSARLERFLQLCGEDNLQVVNCTSPANYFHALRRQLRRPYRKPLIVMSPKSLLRHKMVISKLSEMGPGSTFHRLLWDDGEVVADEKIKRVVLCSGKIYYDLSAEREKRGIKDVYVMRLEQLYPFPFNALTKELRRFPKAEIVWCQEEPENAGAWFFVDRRIEHCLADAGSKATRPRYVGRPSAAATATGLLRRHNREEAELLDGALKL
jgi:2-oxoglutarate dehydrogenase E1 component